MTTSESNSQATGAFPSGDLARRWEERGYPLDLLHEARRLKVSRSELERWTYWNPSLETVQLRLTWAGKLLHGNIRFRQITLADDDAFRELWSNSPEEIGDWDVTVERGPNAFAQFDLQERPVLNALFDGSAMVACVSFSLRRTLAGGRWITVRYGQAMRVHKDHRRHGYANWVRSLPWAIGVERPTQVQYDYIRGRNMEMERWNRKHMPHVDSVPKRDADVPGVPVTVLQFPAKRSSGAAGGIRTARPEDTERCAELINRTHAGRDLFRPYEAQSLFDRLEPWMNATNAALARPVYTWDDFYVVEREGKIVACAGLWDRGRDLSERWRHRETGAARITTVTALLDIGFAEGHEEALAGLIEHLAGVSHELGRDYLVAPLEALPGVAALLSSHEPVPETRYLQWRADDPALTAPAHLDLVYW